MSNLNQILIEGNLTKNPELKHTPKGTPVCTFSVASGRERQRARIQSTSGMRQS